MNFSKIDTMTETNDSLAEAEEQSNKLWRTDGDIREAADLWCTHRAAAEEQYGHISDWDVSSVIDMSLLFKGKYEHKDSQIRFLLFNDDISRWDVSNVTNMSYMFACAFSFDKPIGDWDVSKVTDMCCMFSGAYAFNQAIGDWDVSKVSDMSYMFSAAYSFDKPIENWDMSSVTKKSFMIN